VHLCATLQRLALPSSYNTDTPPTHPKLVRCAIGYEKAHDATAPPLVVPCGPRSSASRGIAIAIGEMESLRRNRQRRRRRHARQDHRAPSTAIAGSSPRAKTVPDIPGICGIVKGAILPGFTRIEAGQSASATFSNGGRSRVRGDADTHAVVKFTKAAAKTRARRKRSARPPIGTTQTARSWWTQPHRPAPRQTLATTPAEIYRRID